MTLLLEITVKFLNKRELRLKVTLSIQHITRLEKAGKFPERIWISTNRVAWLEEAVENWMRERIANQSSVKG